MNNTWLFLQEQRDDKFRLFAPCVETPNETAFLTRNPIDSITSGDYNKVPMMIGYNSNEGLFALLADIGEINRDTTDIPYQYYIPHQMNLAVDSPLNTKIVEMFSRQYLVDRPGDKFLVSTNSIVFERERGRENLKIWAFHMT